MQNAEPGGRIETFTQSSQYTPEQHHTIPFHIDLIDGVEWHNGVKTIVARTVQQIAGMCGIRMDAKNAQGTILLSNVPAKTSEDITRIESVLHQKIIDNVGSFLIEGKMIEDTTIERFASQPEVLRV